jgi:hypothetical protein
MTISSFLPSILSHFRFILKVSKSRISCTLRKTALASTAVAVLTSGCVMMPDTMASVSSVSTVSGYPEISINKRKAAPDKASNLLPKPVSHSYLGRAPYICTPSGFGRTSGCFVRRG